ncbi:MAG TPA: type I DNA topoisomerase [Oculatellaceae cyanobacterium]
MSKSLVIVESPAKAKTIGKILGKDFQVKASVGHVRDLPRNKLGVNVRKNFEPLYEILHDKQAVVDELKAAAKSADQVYLAPDPDREGEAIAWHLSEVLNLPKKKCHRIAFNEITPDAVKAAMKKPRQIDSHLVDAQQARRILDRLVGYKISPILWRKVNGRSAGRVQSVAVRLICERESEIEQFEPKEYWSIKAELTKARGKTSFLAPLAKYDGKRVIAASEKLSNTAMVIESEKQAKSIVKKFEKEDFAVSSVTQKTSQRSPLPPFITSTLQRDASTHTGYTVKKTMQIAQQLYEGVELGSGATGLITYMRTDSTRISTEAQEEALAFIEARYGKDYCPEKPRVYTRKAKGMQDAHEAIRPTSAERTPESIKQYLSSDQFKIYKLIWERFMASQMSSAEMLTRSVEITAGPAVFKATASEVKFPGFTIVYDRGAQATVENNEQGGAPEEEEQAKLPELAKGEALKHKDILQTQHFTQPPPRFNEASMIKHLEELGIGRPSTYQATVATIVDRKYVERQGKTLIPTALGKQVNLLLCEHFSNIVDVGFTAQMEQNLDRIEEDEIDWRGVLKQFYVPFGETLKRAEENMNKVITYSDQLCPACGKRMLIRQSRFGQFLGCEAYPECGTKIALTRDGQPVPEDRPSEEICKTCASPMLIRYGRYGDYLACSSETCEEKRPILKTIGVKCPRPECGGEIVEKKSRRGKHFYGCSHYSLNKCDTAYWYPPVLSGGPKGSNLCPTCGKMLIYKTLKRGDQIACSSKECDFSQPITGEEKHA